MRNELKDSRGYTLIAALLIMVLLSGAAAGLLFLVSNEAKMSGHDQESNLAYYGAESGMEYLDSSLAALYSQYMVPTSTQIQAVATSFTSLPAVPNVTYLNTITFPNTSVSNGSSQWGLPCTVKSSNPNDPPYCWNTIGAGSNQGLYAEVVPMYLKVVASRPGVTGAYAASGAQVSITRQVEVALIPVFQFGVFCGYDCSYFAGPDFSFGGRVHTNMNLFLASGADLVFNDKVQAYQQILTDELENGHLTSSGYGGTTYVPNAASGCPLNTFPPTGTNCKALLTSVPGDASWSGGYPTIAGSANSSFKSISNGTFNDYLANSLTGVSNLQLPFVTNSCTSNPPPCTDPISIIRKPLAGEEPTSTLGSERLYNKSQIRILIADSLADLHPDWTGTDSGDYQFPTSTPTAYNITSPSATTEYFGWGTPGSHGWLSPLSNGAAVSWGASGFPLIGEITSNPTTLAAMSSSTTGGPWIRIEYCSTAPCNTHADFVPVTAEWLGLGFSRQFNTQLTVPNSSNLVDPQAILILQQLTPTVSQSTAAQAQASGHGASTQNNFYPINFYDTREGEMRDTQVNVTTFTPSSKTAPGYPDSFTYSSCSVNGIMSAVELDVGNLNLWLQGKIGSSGTKVNYSQENGYILYFSDHRGMVPDPNPSNGGQTPAGVISGESGIEDVVNSGSNLTSTATDGVLEPTKYYSYSPEDVDQNGKLDNWGEANLGYAFDIPTNTYSPYNPFKTRVGVTAGSSYTTYVDCAGYNTTTSTWLSGNNDQEGLANPVSGARHVLKLVDGGMTSGGVSQVPIIPTSLNACAQSASNPTACGGFTVASENPVYVQGNYNSSSADAFWGTANNATPTQTPHSAASIVADSVTVLSNQWSDAWSLLHPTCDGSCTIERAATASAYYRVAISGGKNIPFPQPSWGAEDFGTDGGMHNFLRYLESWGAPLYYNGSLVSMYYAEYDTGTFKCCTTVYSPPTRDYYFDTLFLNPANLPPGTPEFQDIVNLSYHQNFTPQ